MNMRAANRSNSAATPIAHHRTGVKGRAQPQQLSMGKLRVAALLAWGQTLNSELKCAAVARTPPGGGPEVWPACSKGPARVVRTHFSEIGIRGEMKGRKPKLPHLRVIAGRELGSEREAADRLVDAAPLPQPPAWLSEEAQDEWRRVVPMLTSLAILTALDMATFSAYCQAWAIFKQASEALARMASSTPSQAVC